jgi:hypothetical protein
MKRDVLGLFCSRFAVRSAREAMILIGPARQDFSAYLHVAHRATATEDI